MIGIVLDFLVIWGIARLLSGHDMSEYKLQFIILAGGMTIVGVLLGMSGLPAALILAAYFAAATLGMVFIVGATWRGGVIGAALFLAYKIVFSLALGSL